MANVKLFGALRKHIDSGSPLEIPGEDVRAVLAALCKAYPLVGDALYENGVIRPHFLITINGRDIRMEAGLDTSVSNGDRISVFSPIAGG